METEQYDEDKFNWCKNLIDTALDGSIDLEQLQNIFVQDLWIVAGAAYDKREEVRINIKAMLDIVSDSQGVSGYHQNGDIAEWDEFPEVAILKANAEGFDAGTAINNEVVALAKLAHEKLIEREPFADQHTSDHVYDAISSLYKTMECFYSELKTVTSQRNELVSLFEGFERVTDIWLPKSVAPENEGEAEALHMFRYEYLALLASIHQSKPENKTPLSNGQPVIDQNTGDKVTFVGFNPNDPTESVVMEGEGGLGDFYTTKTDDLTLLVEAVEHDN